MRWMNPIGVGGGLVLLMLFVTPRPASAASHLWQINELFSSADGTIQFVELAECCGAADETDIADLWVFSAANINYFFFPADLPPGSTANGHLLLATPGFAALPNAPTPDYIVPDNFFNTSADILSYFFFPSAEFHFTAGQLPLDGVLSLHRNGSVAPNSPTNFAGQTGSVTVTCAFIRGDANFDGLVNVADAVFILAFLFSDGPSPVPAIAGDVNADANANIADVVYALAHLFSGGAAPPPPFPDAACP